MKNREQGFHTWSKIPAKKVYTPGDLGELDYEKDLNDPGKFPFTRGIYENMYRQRLWNTRNLCGLESPLKTNERLKYLIKEGQSGVAIVPDTPTQLGIDGDHPLAEAQVGTQGVPLYSLQDMDELLSGISLEDIIFSISVCSIAAPIILAQVSALAQKRNSNLKKIRGSIQNDPIQARHCCYDINNPLDLCLHLCTDAVEYCVEKMPSWHSLTVNAYDISESGADAIREMGLTLGNAIEYIELALKRGLDIDSFAHQVLIICSSHIDFFEQIAKIRATRRIWAKLMKERFHAKNPRSMRLTIAVHTAGSSLTTQQPINNVIRGAFEALAAVFSGCQGLDLSCYDEALCTPTEESAMVALRTQQIILNETGVTQVADPLGGSYYLEHLTNEIEKEIWKLLERIDAMGGIISAVKKGWFKGVIDQSALELYNDINSGEKKIVGLNVFQIPEEEDNLLRIGKIHMEPCKDHVQRLKELKSKRDNVKTKEALKALYNDALDEKKNLISSIIEATKCYATIGEIIGTLREAYGCSYDPYEVIEPPFQIGA